MIVYAVCTVLNYAMPCPTLFECSSMCKDQYCSMVCGHWMSLMRSHSRMRTKPRLETWSSSLTGGLKKGIISEETVKNNAVAEGHGREELVAAGSN